MDESEFERELRRLMQLDFPTGTEEFREALLARCLAVLGEDDAGADLDDGDLELLAAAGDAGADMDPGMVRRALFGDNMHGGTISS